MSQTRWRRTRHGAKVADTKSRHSFKEWILIITDKALCYSYLQVLNNIWQTKKTE